MSGADGERARPVPGDGPGSSGVGSEGAETDPSSAPRPRPSWAVIGIFVLLSIGALAFARAFLTPVLLAFLLTLIFSPVRRTLCRTGLPDGAAAALIVGGMTTVLLTAGFLLATPVLGWVSNAPEIGRQIEERVREIRSTLTLDAAGGKLEEAVDDVRDVVAPDSDGAQRVVVEQPDVTERLLDTVPAAGAQSVLVLVLFLFLLASGDMFYEKIVHAIPRFRDKRRAVRTVRTIERKLSRYLLTITAINAGLGLSIGLAMWAFGMPDPLLFGVIGWLFNYVPYLGALAGSALAVAVGLVVFEDLGTALLPGLAYYALTVIEGQFVTPYLVGRNLKLNTVVVFMTIAFWAWLWSVVGMLIAVPVLVVLRTVCEALPPLRPLADFLSARGVEREEESSIDAENPSPAEASGERPAE